MEVGGDLAVDKETVLLYRDMQRQRQRARENSTRKPKFLYVIVELSIVIRSFGKVDNLLEVRQYWKKSRNDRIMIQLQRQDLLKKADKMREKEVYIAQKQKKTYHIVYIELAFQKSGNIVNVVSKCRLHTFGRERHCLEFKTVVFPSLTQICV